MASKHILVVDDEIGIRELLQDILQDEGYQVQLAEHAAAARAMRLEHKPDAVLLDIWMPDCDGITLLKEWASDGLLNMPVIMMSGHGTIDTAIEATRIGAFDFLEKPIALQKLLKTVSAALKHGEQQPKSAMQILQLGKSALMVALKERLIKIANNGPSPVLLLSPTGAGAHLCAQHLRREGAPWLALTDVTKLEQEPLALLPALADGVLYIDEVGTLSDAAQKGLQLLITKSEKYNVRVVCNTSEDLQKLQTAGLFDQNLLHMLSAITLQIPALDAHREDIPELATHIATQYIEENNSTYREFEIAALNALRNTNWPGNIAQLQTVVQHLVQASTGEKITLDDVRRAMQQVDTGLFVAAGQAASQSMALPNSVENPFSEARLAEFGLYGSGLSAAEGSTDANMGLPNLAKPLREARDDFERMYFMHHMAEAGGNMSKLADIAGLERTHLYRKLKQLGIKIK